MSAFRLGCLVLGCMLTVLLIFPVLINCTGLSLYAVTKIGDREFILGSSLGICHLASNSDGVYLNSQRKEDSDSMIENFLQESWNSQFPEAFDGVVDLGVFTIVYENSFGMNHWPSSTLSSVIYGLVGFNYVPSTPEDSYTSVDFPWLLWAMVPGVVVALLELQQKSSRTT